MKVFISHESTNDSQTDIIYDALEDKGVSCWADHRDEPVLHDWAEEIPPAIEESDLVVFLFSQESNGSEQCRKEINFAVNECNIPVFVINLDNSDFNQNYVYNFSLYNYLIAFDGVENHIDEIIRIVVDFRNNPESIRHIINIFNKKAFRFATREYYTNKKQNDTSFNEENIIEALLPTVADEKKEYDVDALIEMIKHQNIVITGQQGGSGKTTLLTKIFAYYLKSDTLIPIYVNMKTLSAKDYVLERYIDMALFDNITAMKSEKTGENIKYIRRELSKESDEANYLILLDGFDEVPEENKDCVLNFLKMWNTWTNTRLVITSRSFDLDAIHSDIKRFHINKLSASVVREYIKSNSKKYYPDLADLLSLPMYLDIYAKSGDTDNIKTKGDLLKKYIEWQNNKNNETKLKNENYAANNTEKIKEEQNYCLNYVLPTVAFYMTTKFKNVLSIKKAECKQVFEDVFMDKSDFLNENTLTSECYLNEYERNNYSIEFLQVFLECKTRMGKKIEMIG